MVNNGVAREVDWSERFTAYRTAHPALAAEYERRMNGDLPMDWQVGASTFINSMVNAGESVASRQASRQALDGFGPMLPELIGGSADLAGSNLTIWSGASPITADDARGNYIYFGVREFGMSAMTMTFGKEALIFFNFASSSLCFLRMVDKLSSWAEKAFRIVFLSEGLRLSGWV